MPERASSPKEALMPDLQKKLRPTVPVPNPFQQTSRSIAAVPDRRIPAKAIWRASSAVRDGKMTG